MLCRITDFFKGLDIRVEDALELDIHKTLDEQLPQETLDSIRAAFPNTPAKDLTLWSMKDGRKDTLLWCYSERPRQRYASYARQYV